MPKKTRKRTSGKLKFFVRFVCSPMHNALAGKRKISSFALSPLPAQLLQVAQNSKIPRWRQQIEGTCLYLAQFISILTILNALAPNFVYYFSLSTALDYRNVWRKAKRKLLLRKLHLLKPFSCLHWFFCILAWKQRRVRGKRDLSHYE